MYGVEWLIVTTLLGLAAGAAGGYLLARQLGAGAQRVRELEEQLATARRQYEDYRHEVVTQFSETARKFQTLNDSYTELHRQLAKSSSILCGDVSGPLLAAPTGHQDLLTDRTRETAERVATPETVAERRDQPPNPRAPAAAPQRTPEAMADGTSADVPGVDTPGVDTPGVEAPSADRPSESPTAAVDTSDEPSGKADEAHDEEPPTLRERVERAARSAQPPAADPDVPILSDIRVAEPADGRDALKRPRDPAEGAASDGAAASDSRPEAAPTAQSEARSAGAGRS